MYKLSIDLNCWFITFVKHIHRERKYPHGKHTCGFSRLFFNKRSEISNTVYTHLLPALRSWMHRIPVC